MREFDKGYKQCLMDNEKKIMLSLRDQFAMTALPNIIYENMHVKNSMDSEFKQQASIAYKYADAMIEARKC